MSALALDAAPAGEEVRTALPGGGGPGGIGPHDGGGGGGGGGDRDGDEGRHGSLLRFATVLGLVSVVAFFTSLALVFVLRSRTPFLWTPVQLPRLLWLGTALLTASSMWLEAARRALARGNATVYRERVLATAMLGFGFLVCQGVSVYRMLEAGVYAKANPYASVFYLFTGLHALHLLGGLAAVNWLVLHGRRTFARERSASGAVAVYWHAMDAVWIGLFAILLVL